jgi:hypothetical protein
MVFAIITILLEPINRGNHHPEQKLNWKLIQNLWAVCQNHSQPRERAGKCFAGKTQPSPFNRP